MTEQRWLDASSRWIRLLLYFYPPEFRDEMGAGVVEAYRDSCRAALRQGGAPALVSVSIRALLDCTRNGLIERARPAVRWRARGGWGRDLGFTTRRLVRAPAFVAALVATLGVGLGAFAVVYTVVHKVLLAPMPYEDPDDLYFVWRNYPWSNVERAWLAGTDIAVLGNAGGVIEDVAPLWHLPVILSGSGDLDPTEISLVNTTPNLFDLLGVRPALGRGFAPNAVGPGRERALVLSYDLWKQLGGDSSIVGTTLRLNGNAYPVVGVMPRGFPFVVNAMLGPPLRADAYITFGIDLAATNPRASLYGGLIRARRGTHPAAVAAAVDAVAKVINERDFGSRGLKMYPLGLKADLVSDVRPALVVLATAGVFLVLVLTVNLATLLLARAAQREQELAVSWALGANRLALVRAMLLEGAVLGLLGGIAATLAGGWATRALVALAPVDLPRRESIALDWGIAGVVIGTGLLLGVVAATIPAAWAARTSPTMLLASSAVRGGGGHGRMRRAMVVVQVALSLVLLSAGALVVRSFERLMRADPGFDPEGVITLRVPAPIPIFPDTRQVLDIQGRIHESLASLPGVDAVSAADALPLTGTVSNVQAIRIPGAPGNSGDRDHDNLPVDFIGARAGYADVMRMRLLTGRGFELARREGVREALIDRAVASHFFPAGNPLGARIPFSGDSLTVVGVVEQARLYDIHRDGRPQIYLRAEDWPNRYRSLYFVVRTAREPSSVIPEARAAIRRIDPQLAVAEVRTMSEIVDDALRPQRITAVLIAGFALGALLLAAMGLFGVVSASVLRRRHEMAVRLALGAHPHGVLRLVLEEGVRLIALGVLIGLPGTYAAGRVIRGVLVGVSPSDPATLSGVAILLATVAITACYLPARRVLRIDPACSLRQE